MNRALGKYPIIPAVVTCFCMFLPGCKKAADSPVIARVGKSVLTVQDLSGSIPPEYSGQISREQKIQYVKRWVDMELLYQEALRRKVDHEPQIQARLEKMKKDLLSAEMISRTDGALESMIGPDAVHQYYEQHRQEFIRARDMVRYLTIVVKTPTESSTLKKTLTKDNFEQIAAQKTSGPVEEITRVPLVAVDQVPQSIREAVLSADVPGIVGPVNTGNDYCFIKVLERLQKGGICSENEVREEIRNTLASQVQKQRIEQVLADLRLKNNIEYHFDVIPSPSQN